MKPDTSVPDEFAKNLSPIQPEDLIAKEEDYRVGPNDLISVGIADLVGPGVETVKSVRISDTGIISLPLIGTINGERRTVRCHVEGETRRLVTKAHQDRSPVICTGDLAKEGKAYHLKNVREMEIVEGEE